jgi:hypothetical protein
MRRADETIPPIIGTAMRCMTSGPVPVLHVMGNNPAYDHEVSNRASYLVPYGSGDPFIGMEEIAERKECGAQSAAGKIEVVTNAIFLAPAHGGELLKSLGNMGEDDEQKTGGAEELQQRAGSSAFAKEEGCSEKQHDGGYDAISDLSNVAVIACSVLRRGCSASGDVQRRGR